MRRLGRWTLNLFALLLVVAWHGCAAAPTPVLETGTKAYGTKVATFSITPDIAWQAVLAEMERRKREHLHFYLVDREPAGIVGNSYFFPRPFKDRLTSEGFYVDGMTGQARYEAASTQD